MSDPTHLPPTEELFLEVLAARTRLGETWWTFGNNASRAGRSLQDKGLVDLIHGVVERTFRAQLTDEGRQEVLDSSYKPRLFIRLNAALTELAHHGDLTPAGKRKLEQIIGGVL